MNTQQIKQIAIHALEDLKAIDITILDVHKITTITDVMIICSARSTKHMQSLAQNVVTQAKAKGYKPLGMDGENSSEWVLVDLGNVVVHVMMPDTRELYKLENLWGAA